MRVIIVRHSLWCNQALQIRVLCLHSAKDEGPKDLIMSTKIKHKLSNNVIYTVSLILHALSFFFILMIEKRINKNRLEGYLVSEIAFCHTFATYFIVKSGVNKNK